MSGIGARQLDALLARDGRWPLPGARSRNRNEDVYLLQPAVPVAAIGRTIEHLPDIRTKDAGHAQPIWRIAFDPVPVLNPAAHLSARLLTPLADLVNWKAAYVPPSACWLRLASYLDLKK